MKRILVIVSFLSAALYAAAQTPVKWMPYIQQNGLYFSSEHVTSTGAGIGLGLAVGVGNHFLAQSDVNIYWINGNAVSTRLAAGYKRTGTWAPAILGNVSLLWGGRTEVLLEDGQRPVSPVVVVGLRFAGLRFENDKGFVSALELGFGFGPYKGTCPELSILSVGINL
jgi:hypothetical protein